MTELDLTNAKALLQRIADSKPYGTYCGAMKPYPGAFQELFDKGLIDYRPGSFVMAICTPRGLVRARNMSLLLLLLHVSKISGLENTRISELVVLLLSANNSEYTIGGLSNLLSCPKPRICRIVDRLEELGMVIRVENKADRRVVFIRPTEVGLNFIAEMKRIAA